MRSPLARARTDARRRWERLKLDLRIWSYKVTWPRVAWIVVLLLVIAYLIQDRPAPVPKDVDLAELNCLALNIYFEARNESLEGKRAVGHVVMNRVADAAFPQSICQVVRQGGEKRRNGCQFSWWCDGRSDKPVDSISWDESRSIAWDIMSGASRDPTRGALWYHAIYAAPAWRKGMMEGRTIGRHIFYHRP
jgi:spore germination cell wall hydrolase CwlJ-like protein